MAVRRRFGLAGLAVAALLAATGCQSGDSPERTAAPDFHQPAPYGLASLAETRPFVCARWDTQCARAYLVDITVEHGPGAGLAMLGRLQRDGSIDPSVDDHQLAHALGRETARRFGVNTPAFELCPVTFNYGCVHGFFEFVLGRAATPRDAATAICDSIADRVLTSRFSCYHGVGHGVMMARAYALEASLGVCDSLGDSTAQEGCWQGVFMENVNAGMRDEARQGVFVEARPLAPCTVVAEKYRHECYINQAGWLMHVSRLSVEGATRICLGAPGPYVSVCAQSIGLMVTNPSWQDNLAPTLRDRPPLEVARALCRRFPPPLREDCVIGGVDNLANFDGADLARARGFCAAVEPAYRRSCYGQVGLNLSRRSNDPGFVGEQCRTVPAPYRSACVAGAGEAEPAAAPATSTVSTVTRPEPPAAVAGATVVRMEAGRFAPARVTVARGATVTFLNASADDKWPASDVHPTHELYPGFDAGRSVVPGGSWSFTFRRRGRWTFHDHLEPSVTGTIVVR